MYVWEVAMLIEVKNLKKEYKTYERGETFKDTIKSLFNRKTITVEALKGISFNIDEGELVGFLGPNGAGKSTTLKILSGILFPTSGDVNIMGYVPWTERKKYVAHIGAVFGQKSQLLWDIPPLDAFHMNKAIYDIPTKAFKARLDEMVARLDVEKHIHRPTRQLSLGERMKCEFIMAMLHGPRIVFLDEPTIGLDVIAKQTIREFIQDMNDNGVTFILTTHDLEDIEHLAKRVMVVNHGEIVFDDTLSELKKYTGDRKILKLTAHTPIGDIDLPGVTTLGGVTPYNKELELDCNVTSLNAFMDFLGKTCTIKDMLIEEPPIDDVIKALYLKEKDASIKE